MAIKTPVVTLLWAVSLLCAEDKTPIAFLNASNGVSSYTAKQVRSGTAAIAIWNKGPELDVAPVLSPFYREASDVAPGFPLSIKPKITLSSGKSPGVASVKLPIGLTVLALTVDADIDPGNYSGKLSLFDAKSKAAVPELQLRIVANNPDLLVSKLTVPLTRYFPWDDKSYCSTSFEVPLAPGPVLQITNRALGGVQKDLGGWAAVKWVLPRRFEVETPLAAGKYTGDVVLWQDPNKATLSLTVLVQDFILWPMLTIAAGILLAFVVKRYIGVTRVVLSVRQQESLTRARFKILQRSFRAASAGASFQNYSISDDVDQRLGVIDAALDKLSASWSTTIAKDDGNYTAAINGLSEIDDGLAIWGRFGPALRGLEHGRDQVADAARDATVFPASVSESDPAIMSPIAGLLEGVPVMLVDLAALSQKVADLTSVAQAWPDACTDLSKVTKEFLGLDLPESLTAEQTAQISTLQGQLATAWRNLFGLSTGADLTSMTAMGGPLGATRAQLDQLEIALGMAAGPLSKGLPSLPQVPPLSATPPVAIPDDDQLPELDTRRAELLRRKIAAGDVGSTVFAAFIALLTGLKSYYFGNPFGQLSDYVALFLWAAGIKAGLDILSGVLDQFTSWSSSRRPSG